jgi:nucleoid-associated protein YgaU
VIFDTYEGPEESMENVHDKYTSKLFKLLEISSPSLKVDPNAKAGSPPPCSFHWGTNWTGTGFMTACSVTWTLFNSKGTPVRAKASFTITQNKDDTPEKTNPTSGGEGGQTSYVVQPGDTLEHIAYEEWGDPTQWRRLAQANGLENPMVLKPGQRLVIPTS